MAFVENPLNIYQSYTYDIELAISPYSIGSQSGASLPQGSGIIIAKTGKTANYYVERVEFTSVPSSSSTNMNFIVSDLKVDVIEPMGFTLYDRYFTALKMAGWQYPGQAAIYVTISYSGWLPDGTFDHRVHAKQYRCIITDISIDFEASQSRYTFLMRVLDETGLELFNSINNRMFKSQIKPTLESTLKELETNLNKSPEGYETAQNKPSKKEIIYKLQLGSRLAGLGLKMYTERQVGTDTHKNAPDDKLYFQAMTGQSIDNMLKKLVLNAKDVSKHLLPKIKPDGTRELYTPDGDLQKWLLVQSQVSYPEYDAEKGKYRQEITYTIDSHYRPDSEVQPPKTPGESGRAQSYISQGLLVKKYEYLFTGKNTEILDLKLDFNNRYRGLVATYNTTFIDQIVATNNEHRLKEDHEKKKRLLATTISGGGSVSGNGSGNGMLLEEIDGNANMVDMVNITVQPISTQSDIMDGVGAFDDQFTIGHKMKLAEVEAQAKSKNMANEFGHLTQNLSEITMVVRGDPYWLRVSDLENNYTNSGSNDSQNSANINHGTLYFYLTFKMGDHYDPASGLTTINPLYFKGIYLVKTITNLFENGRFTQQINGVLDVTTLGVELD